MILAVDAFNLAADRRGMGRVVRQTLRALPELGVQPVLVARPRDIAAIREQFGFSVVAPPELRGLDHAATWFPWNSMRFDPRAPSAVTIHDPFAFTFAHPNLVARLREQQPIRRAIARADRIFTVSEWTAQQLRDLFRVDERRLRVVHNAPDPFWKPVPPPERPPYILFLGGTEARKNAAMLYEAYAAAFTDGGPQLVAPGAIADEELRVLYSGALAVLVPSLAEGFGLPAVEAMACGAPVLAANAAALPETCGGAALLLPASDMNAWREALRRIAADPALREDLRARGLERARQFDPQGSAKALLAFLRQADADAR